MHFSWNKNKQIYSLVFFYLRTGPRSTFVPNGNGQNHLTVIVDKGPQIALPVLQKVAVRHTWMIPCWILPPHKGGKCENSWRIEDWKKIGRDLPNCRVLQYIWICVAVLMKELLILFSNRFSVLFCSSTPMPCQRMHAYAE